MSRTGGIPLLSGRPPPHSGPSQSACRKCGREFSILFNRRRECTHCGYDYCSSCTDYQALVPRRGPTQGYSLAPVCAYCIEMLNITALGRAQLRSLPLAKLRRYIESYNILVRNPVDKNDLVDAAIAARTPQGCLSPVNENFYRKYSVPSSYTPGPSSSSANRNSSPRGSPNTNANSSSRSNPNRSFPRPDLDPNHQQRPQEAPYSTYTPRSAPNAPRSRTTSAPMNPGMTPPTSRQPDIPRPTSSSGRQSAPSSSSTAHVSSPPPFPPPPMSTLVTLPRSYLSGLSVSALKQILFEARVRVPPGVVEKEELVGRVWALVEEEKRKDDEGLDDVGFDTREHETEDMESPNHAEEANHHRAHADGVEHGAHVSSPPPFPPPPMSTLVTLPRSFLSGLSVSALKQILFEARVRVPPGVVEKEELVERVWALVEEEKREDDEGLDTREDEMGDMESPDWAEEADHYHAHADGVGHGHVQGDYETSHEEHFSVPAMDSDLRSSRPATPHPSTSPPKPPTSPLHPSPRSKPRAHPQPTTAERSGLCVVCQDEEACIAIVDCGHLAMCRACSDLVLASSRECPLCRTRIVTEARLLRIFKT